MSDASEGDKARCDRSWQLGQTGEGVIDGRRAGAPLGDGPDDERGTAAGVTARVHAGRRSSATGRPSATVPRPAVGVGTRGQSSRSGTSVPMKPAASSTRSAGSSVRESGQRAGSCRTPSTRTISTSSTTTARTAPLPSSAKDTTSRAQASCTPSSWAGDVPTTRHRRRATDRVHQVLAALRTRVVVEHRHRQRALPVGRAQAVGRGVAAADDDHVLAAGVDPRE